MTPRLLPSYPSKATQGLVNFMLVTGLLFWLHALLQLFNDITLGVLP